MLNVTVNLFPDSRLVALQNCVPRYELRQGLSEIFELTIELILTNASFDMKDAVGQLAEVSFSDEPFLFEIEGMVRRMRQLSAEVTGVSRYEISVVSPLWLTTRRRDHRIFQDKSVIEVVQEVIQGYGGRIPDLEDLTGDHARREYCVQYGETDFDFICRILADEGISFFFDHDQKLSATPPQSRSPSSILTLVDDTTVFAQQLETTIHFVPPAGGLQATKPHVQRVLVSSGVETSAVTVRDYDFERPAFKLEAKDTAASPLFTNEPDLESYTYEVGQFTTADGKDRAAQFLEEGRGKRQVYDLETSFSLAPGTRLTVADHPNEDANGEKLVVQSRTRVSSDAQSRPVASHVLQCTPAAEKYRPARRPKPRIHGTQTAFVVGKKLSEDEIEVDKYGRVKVHFTWDRRDSSFEGKPTRFIRVSQAWAGQGYGMVLLPRVGDEVIVTYLDGDPDEPLVVGRVHNAVYTSPLNLASNPDDYTVSIWKSRSSPADKSSGEDRYNMVRMQDKAGAEMLELRAQRDFHHETLHDSNTEVGHNQSIQVKGSQSTSAGSISMSSGSTISIDAKTAITEHAGTTVDLTAGTQIKVESVTVLVNGKVVTSVHGGAMLYLHGGVTAYLTGGVSVEVSAGSLVSVKAPTVNVEGSGNVNVTGGEVKVTGSKVSIEGGTVNLNC
jgi:type VI secretion system secreted protein VgrG